MFFAPADVIFSPKRGVQPDLLVVPGVDGRSPESFAEAKRLLLAIETLSPGTARWTAWYCARCIATKACLFWIVDLDSRTFERSTPADSRVEVLDERIEWMPAGASMPLTIDVTAYFAEVLEA